MRGTEWTQEEMDVLAAYYGRGRSTMERLLPRRTWRAISGKARRLMLRAKPGRMEWCLLLATEPDRQLRYYARLMGTTTATARKWVRELCAPKEGGLGNRD